MMIGFQWLWVDIFCTLTPCVCDCEACDIVFLVMQCSGACSICVVRSKYLMLYKKWVQVQSLSICMHGYCVALLWISLHENTIFEI